MCKQLSLSITDSKKMLCGRLHSRELSNVLISKVHKTDDDFLSDIREFIEVSSECAERFRTDSRTTTTIHNKPSNRGTANQPYKIRTILKLQTLSKQK